MTGLYHGWSREPDTHADFQHNGVDVDDFFIDMPHRKKSTKKSKRFRGCPANDGKAHVYVWTTESTNDWTRMYEKEFFDKRGFHRREFKVCCGCGKQNKFRYTEQMQKLISRKGWYQANYGD